ncbi:hypothetical protein [Inquilinus sp.]|uniref:hypothetical protein n=1 Tax=Inquilinus sp. TaxID=1932117 RepID=UPI0031D5458C
MDRFISAVQQALASKNWYAALALALTLPDICIGLEEKSGHKNFAAWFDDFMSDKYSYSAGAYGGRAVFLTGDDFYALRCAYLHAGTDVILDQRARRILERFVLVAPRPGFTMHCNMIDDTLQLQVDMFCADICDGVRKWISEVYDKDPDVRARSSSLVAIKEVGQF